MKRTFIVNYPIMISIGGIEKYLYYLMKYMLNHGVRVIWMQNIRFQTGKMYDDVIKDPRLEIVKVNSNLLFWFKHEKLNLSKDEEIVIFSCTTMAKLKADTIVRRFSDLNIKSIYGIPDTKGDAYYLEAIFCNPLKFIVYRCMRTVFEEWENNNHLCFYARKQIDALENNYHVHISNKDTKLLKYVEPLPLLNYDELEKRIKRCNFTIITIGRFDFPHKQYILGLIRAYGRLKEKYPQIRLDIVGDGPHRFKVIQEIEKLNSNIQKDIKLLGSVSPEVLPACIKHAHLNISVAGGVSVGAINGIMSIPARNYCEEECEVYGYLPEYLDYSVSTSPGNLVDTYIERVINMSDFEYKKACIESYESVYNSREVDPNYLFGFSKCTKRYLVPLRTLLFLIVIDYIKKAKYFFTIFLKGRISQSMMNLRNKKSSC